MSADGCRMEGLQSIEEIDAEITKSVETFGDVLGVECMFSLVPADLTDIYSSILPSAIRNSRCQNAPEISCPDPRPVHRELERRCRGLALGRHGHTGETT